MVDSESINDYYTLGKELGQGSFGVVKKVIKKDDGSEYACKIINKTKLEENELASLQSEVEILSSIDHPNIVKLYEVFEDDNDFFMILELMMGGELFERIVDMDNFNEQLAAESIIPIIDALNYCHQEGIAHRDLKPQNLLFANKNSESVVKISDFGLARIINKGELM